MLGPERENSGRVVSNVTPEPFLALKGHFKTQGLSQTQELT